TFRLDADVANRIYERALAAGINLRRDDAGGLLGISVNEKTTRAHIAAVLQSFTESDSMPDIAELDRGMDANATSIPAALQRQSDFLQHPVFHRYHSETEMLRYLKRLENKDLSLAHAMISLGSCT